MLSHVNRRIDVTEVIENMEGWAGNPAAPHPKGENHGAAFSRIRFDPTECAHPWFAYNNCALMKFLLRVGLLHAFKGLFKLCHKWRLTCLQAVTSHDAPQIRADRHLTCVIYGQDVF